MAIPHPELTFYRFCSGYPTDDTDLADLCGEIRVDREAPRTDKELRAHLEFLFGDNELIGRLWRLYRREVRKQAKPQQVGGHR
jgi:hypothetical protein